MNKQTQLVGLDTSFILRLLLGEPEAQAERAIAKLDEIRADGRKGAVNDLVVSEAYFALQYHYGVPKQLALNKLLELLTSPEIEATGHARLVLAFPDLAKASPGFVDRLIHADYQQTTDGMLTFEKAASKLPSVTVLKSE